jgi:DNA gyrase subunit A
MRVRVQVVEKEALALKKDFGTPRRTMVEQGRDGEINDIDMIANEETIVVSCLSYFLHGWI